MVSACLEARARHGGRALGRARRRAFAWFLGHNQLQKAALRPDDRRVPRRAPRRPREREPGRRVDALVSPGARWRCARRRATAVPPSPQVPSPEHATGRGYEILFQRHARQPHPHGRRLALPGAHASSTRPRRGSLTARRSCSAAWRTAAVSRTSAPRAPPTASTAGSSIASRRCAPIPTDTPRSCGESRTRASRSSRSSASTSSPTPRSARAAPASRSRSPRTFAPSSASAWSCSPTTRTRRSCRGASTAASR